MSSSANSADYRRRADKYRALAAKAADVIERDGICEISTTEMSPYATT